MSNDKVLTLRGKRAVWAPAPKDTGPIDPARLPEGYPYKEQSESVFVKEAEATFSDTSDGVVYSTGILDFVENVKVTIGETYIVKWDGQEYERTAFSLDGLSCIGNGAFWNGHGFDGYEDTGEPFSLVFDEYSPSATATTNSAGVHTFSVRQVSETIHPMSEEFLPEGVGGVSFVTFTDSAEIFCSVSFEKLLSMLCNFAAVNACVYKRSASDSSSADYLPVESIRFMPNGSGYIEIHVPDDSRYIKYSADGLSWDGGES